jgi:phosphopantothenate synthetase
MEALKIEILNPKALQLIKALQDLNLIKITEEPVSKLKSYLKKTRKNDVLPLSLDEITKIVEDVRAERNVEK